jgi:UDP-glucuronate 4-epimerase
VYGDRADPPFEESQPTDSPVSLYAATKKANELMAHAYSHLYGLPATGLRFFTVYGPWGRPDMAYFSFAEKICARQPLPVFGHGTLQRDFTYIDDIVEGVCRVLQRVPAADQAWSSDAPDPSSSRAPYRLYNIGNHSPVELARFIAVLEGLLGKKAKQRLLPMQPGDVVATYADVADLARDVGFEPATPLEVGLERFVRWYREYYEA